MWRMSYGWNGSSCFETHYWPKRFDPMLGFLHAAILLLVADRALIWVWTSGSQKFYSTTWFDPLWIANMQKLWEIGSNSMQHSNLGWLRASPTKPSSKDMLFGPKHPTFDMSPCHGLLPSDLFSLSIDDFASRSSFGSNLEHPTENFFIGKASWAGGLCVCLFWMSSVILCRNRRKRANFFVCCQFLLFLFLFLSFFSLLFDVYSPFSSSNCLIS